MKNKRKANTRTKNRVAKPAILQKWYFMAINYRVFRSFRISLFDHRQIKKSVRAHLFRKMAIYIEFDHLLVLWPLFHLRLFFSCSNYEFSGEWSSVNWSNLRKTADKWKVWKTFKKWLPIIMEWFFNFFGFGTMVFSKVNLSSVWFLCAMKRTICSQLEKTRTSNRKQHFPLVKRYWKRRCAGQWCRNNKIMNTWEEQ